MRFRRFEIAGESMIPTLTPGDFVVGDQHAPIRATDIVAVEHPDRQDFWLVKRVLALEGMVDLAHATVNGAPYIDEFRDMDGDRGRFEIPRGSMFVASDNRRATVADSRSFGAVRTDSAFRIRIRYWPVATFRCF